MAEIQIQNQILEYLNSIPGCFAYATPNTGRIRNGRVVSKAKKKGISDTVACFKGLYIAIEVKDDVGVMSDDQIQFKRDIESAGGIYWLCRSLEDAMQEVARIL